jgi:hypothetical protein
MSFTSHDDFYEFLAFLSIHLDRSLTCLLMRFEASKAVEVPLGHFAVGLDQLSAMRVTNSHRMTQLQLVLSNS